MYVLEHDPAIPRITLDIQALMKRAGYWHESGKYADSPNVAELQRRTGLTYVSVSDLVNHSAGIVGISLEVLSRLCAALNCKPGDLFKVEAPNQPPAPMLEQWFRDHPGEDPYGQDRNPHAPINKDVAVTRW